MIFGCYLANGSIENPCNGTEGVMNGKAGPVFLSFLVKSCSTTALATFEPMTTGHLLLAPPAAISSWPRQYRGAHRGRKVRQLPGFVLLPAYCSRTNETGWPPKSRQVQP